jgi:DNA-directed RNA polymerase specialized sigma24 family protein
MSYEHLPDKPTDFWEQMLTTIGDPENYEPDWEMVEAVRYALTLLEPEDKMLIELLMYDKFSYNEITETMGYSSKSVAWYKTRRALEKLKEPLLEQIEIRRKYSD